MFVDSYDFYANDERVFSIPRFKMDWVMDLLQKYEFAPLPLRWCKGTAYFQLNERNELLYKIWTECYTNEDIKNKKMKVKNHHMPMNEYPYEAITKREFWELVSIKDKIVNAYKVGHEVFMGYMDL